MEDEKYYTPEAAEFHDGFEYQLLNSGQWLDMVFVVKMGLPCNPNETRVQKLCREDIEELGWEYQGRVGTEEKYHLNWSMLFYYPDQGEIHIEKEGYTLYHGLCRNKSHLRQLMKDLGITK
jgi:hypothetical protein